MSPDEDCECFERWASNLCVANDELVITALLLLFLFCQRYVLMMSHYDYKYNNVWLTSALMRHDRGRVVHGKQRGAHSTSAECL